MSLRPQKSGIRKAWTLEELRAGFEKFHTEHGRYPTAPEIDNYEYLPSSRSIERSYGGLIRIRQLLNLGGQDDYRKGAHSSERARMIGKRANSTEKTVYDFLCNRFKKEFVHREYFFTDDARTRADFFVYDAEGNFCVDVFYPSDYRNLTGCINSKLQKYTEARLQTYPVIFLQMNPDISQEQIDRLLERKKNKLHKAQRLVGWDEFEKFCRGRTGRT